MEVNSFSGVGSEVRSEVTGDNNTQGKNGRFGPFEASLSSENQRHLGDLKSADHTGGSSLRSREMASISTSSPPATFPLNPKVMMSIALILLVKELAAQKQNGTSDMQQFPGNDSELYRLIEANGTSGWNVTTDGAENGEPPWLTPVVAVLCALVFIGVNVLMFFVDDPGKKEFYRDRTPDRPEAPDESYVAVPIEEPSNPTPAVGQNMLSKDNAQSVAFNTRTEVVSIDQLEEWQGIDAQEEKGPIEQQ